MERDRRRIRPDMSLKKANSLILLPPTMPNGTRTTNAGKLSNHPLQKGTFEGPVRLPFLRVAPHAVRRWKQMQDPYGA